MDLLYTCSVLDRDLAVYKITTVQKRHIHFFLEVSLTFHLFLEQAFKIGIFDFFLGL